MSATPGSPRRRGSHRPFRSACALVAVVLAALMGTPAASAYWGAPGSGWGNAATGVLTAPAVAVPTTATGDVPVSWSHSGGAVTPTGFYVTRHSGGTSVAACASSPTSLIDATGCSDSAVLPGTYTYTATAVFRSWSARSTPSTSIVVTAPSLLGAAQSFSVLAATAVVSTGATSVSGDVGVSPGTLVSGFGPGGGSAGGDIHAGDAHAAAARDATAEAYTALSTRTATASIVGDLGGRTLTAGVYRSTAAMALTGVLTLDAGGDADAVFIFQTTAAFNTAAASAVVLAGGARASNVYWVIGGAAGTGADSFLSGTIVAAGAITLGASTQLIGRALSRDAVTLAANIIRFTADMPPTLVIAGGPTSITKDRTPTISGTTDAPPASPLTVTVAGQTMTTTVGADGAWSVTAAELTAGVHTVTAKVRDTHGNGASSSQNLSVEISPPSIALRTAATYSVLAATAVVNTGATTMTGDLGVSPGTAVTGFPPGHVDGSVHAGDIDAAVAQSDLSAALDDGSSRLPHTQVVGDLGGRTFHVGVHHSTAALALTGEVTLDGEGDPEAVFIFQTDAAFNTAAGSEVTLTGGAQASHVFWVVTGAAGTGANSDISGSILARGAITLGAGTALTGPALSLGTVTLAGNALDGVAPAPIAPAARDAAPEEETPPAPIATPPATASPTPSAEASASARPEPEPTPTATP